MVSYVAIDCHDTLHHDGVELIDVCLHVDQSAQETGFRENFLNELFSSCNAIKQKMEDEMKSLDVLEALI